MNERVFVDTNVLIYARDRRDADKRERAAAWLLTLGSVNAAWINLQVVNELTNWILRHEPQRPFDEVQEELALLRSWGANPIADEEVETAWAVRRHLGYQWFDCLLLASACNAGCTIFLTEDMSHGATFEGLTLINPFRASPDDVLRRN
jgi:predicted nucleic acid-binding protein